jgi:hypothetical protein
MDDETVQDNNENKNEKINENENESVFNFHGCNENEVYHMASHDEDALVGEFICMYIYLHTYVSMYMDVCLCIHVCEYIYM